MNAEIKAYADSGDLKSLKYIFVDSLDVDPTFANYEEEYNYCKSIPGLLEPHVEMTPFTGDPAKWTDEYWTNLKMDLIQNFSDTRMTHMRNVAKVFLADKLRRILAERETAAAAATAKQAQAVTAPAAEKTRTEIRRPEPMHETPVSAPQAQPSPCPPKEERPIEAEPIASRKISPTPTKKEEPVRSAQKRTTGRTGAEPSKKVIGIAAALIAAAAAILILILK